MARLARVALAAALAGGLTACSGTPVVNSTFVVDTYHPYVLGYADARGGMLTEIVGNPFEVDKQTLDERVTRAFEARSFGPKADFITEAPSDYRSPYRVVVLFNPAPWANAARLCSNPERPQVQSSDGVRVLAAFCNSDVRISSALANLSGTSDPDDPAFSRFMTQVVLALFPPQPPKRGPGESFF